MKDDVSSAKYRLQAHLEMAMAMTAGRPRAIQAQDQDAAATLVDAMEALIDAKMRS